MSHDLLAPVRRLLRAALLPLCLTATVLVAACGGADGPAPSAQGAAPRAEHLAPKAAFTPQSGLWWNPQESGRGFTFELQGNQIFMASYMYEASGVPVWYITTLNLVSGATFAGSMERYSGGQSLTGSYRPATPSTSARATLTFASGTTGSLTLALTDGSAPRTVSVERFALSSPALAPSNASFDNGIWWNPNESGRGFLIDVQGSTAVMASYMYETSGAPVWYLMQGSLQGGNSFAGNLEQYSGGQTLVGSYRAPTLSPSTPGRVTFTAASRTSASLALPNGQTVPLVRFIFNSAAPIAVEPPASGPSAAALAGKSFYNGICASCHGAPASNFNRVLNGANNPTAILNAVNNVGAMNFLRGTVGPTEAANLAEYLANPGI